MGELFKHLHFNLDLNRINASSGERTAAITFLDTALRRNRQCVLAYLNYRLERLRDLVWDQVGREEDLPATIKERLDQDEIKYVRQYDAIVNQYMSELNEGSEHEFQLDVFTDSLPPISAVTEVEVLADFEGHLTGTRFLARRQIVEPHILQGKARHLYGMAG
ncbi:hypothetical protein C9890_0504 [Perkinsus sp. BL_2016]|nr:hypothetical protein C9890_0504 [Perkinsus sp. BL_2016]